jgi:hypothetical protein
MYFAQLIGYKYDADETRMVWSPDLSVQTFSGLAPFIIDEIIHGSLYVPISGYIKDARDEIMNNLLNFQSALKKLRDSLQSYNTTIKGSVPRYWLK